MLPAKYSPFNRPLPAIASRKTARRTYRRRSVGLHLPAGLLAGSRQGLQKVFPIQIIAKNLLPPIASAHQVVNRSLVLNSQLARHRQFVTPKQQPVSIVRTDPYCPPKNFPLSIATYRWFLAQVQKGAFGNLDRYGLDPRRGRS
jgi:hypothetical protein